MNTQPITAVEVRELCARLNRNPQTLAELFERNADMLTRLDSPKGAAIERQNARACRALVIDGKEVGL